MRFNRNMPGWERAVRAVVGTGGIALAIVQPGFGWGWLGIIPLATAVVAFCPLYTALGIRAAGER